MAKKKGRWQKPAGKPAKAKKPGAADQAALEAALTQSGDPGNAGAAAAPAASAAAPPSGAPMTDQARMLSRYGAGS
jgi:hypothetical protein